MTRPKIIIIQLLRLGDLLQTLQAVQMVSQQNPLIDFHLIARSQYARPLLAFLKSCFKEVYLLDTNHLIETFKHKGLGSATSHLQDLRKKTSQHKYEVLINYSFTFSSSILSTLVASKHKLGMHHNDLGQITIYDKWSQYLYAVVMSSPLNPFSLVDLYRKVISEKATSFPPLRQSAPKNAFSAPFCLSKEENLAS